MFLNVFLSETWSRVVAAAGLGWRLGLGGGGLSRLAKPPERGCGGRFVEMVIICCIDLSVARAAGAHTHTHAVDTHRLTYTQEHCCVAETDPFILISFTFP